MVGEKNMESISSKPVVWIKIFIFYNVVYTWHNEVICFYEFRYAYFMVYILFIGIDG